MKTKEIRDLIDFISKTGLNEVNIETDELKLSIKRDPDVSTQLIESQRPITIPNTSVVNDNPNPTPQGVDTTTEGVEEQSDETGNYTEIKSPMIGTFYRTANPEADPFVKVGDSISPGQTVCIIEAMKLFNEIESEISGTVVKILVENSTPVEYDQPLFLVDPA